MQGFLFLLVVGLLVGSSASAHPLLPLPPRPHLKSTVMVLGKKLFHDIRLSKNQDVSCASCHPIGSGGADGVKLSKGTGGGTTKYNTPSIFNAASVMKFGWEGIPQNLKEATIRAISSPKAMDMQVEEIAVRLQQDPIFVREFQESMGELNAAHILEALMVYMEYLVPRNSRFDLFLMGNESALSAEQKKGYQRFIELGCVSCHQGSGVGGNMFARFGVMVDPFEVTPKDHLGRFNATQKTEDLHVFRVPSLRNVAVTAPYFHDGRAPDLNSAIRTMGFVQLGIRVSDEDLRLLQAFLSSLTGHLPPEVMP